MLKQSKQLTFFLLKISIKWSTFTISTNNVNLIGYFRKSLCKNVEIIIKLILITWFGSSNYILLDETHIN